MEIRIIRNWFGANSCLSVLKIDGEHRGYVCEDKDRGLTSAMSAADIASKKIYGKTAIPTGRYRVTVTYSNRFRRQLPLLHDVPGFSGIRIHSGNDHTHTEGCLLPGKTYQVVNGDYQVLRSREMMKELEEEISEAIKNNEIIWCEITRN